MNEQETKDRVWKDFLKFMQGQTIGVAEDGSIIYYDWDVERYCRWSHE